MKAIWICHNLTSAPIHHVQYNGKPDSTTLAPEFHASIGHQRYYNRCACNSTHLNNTPTHASRCIPSTYILLDMLPEHRRLGPHHTFPHPLPYVASIALFERKSLVLLWQTSPANLELLHCPCSGKQQHPRPDALVLYSDFRLRYRM